MGLQGSGHPVLHVIDAPNTFYTCVPTKSCSQNTSVPCLVPRLLTLPTSVGPGAWPEKRALCCVWPLPPKSWSPALFGAGGQWEGG